MPLFTSPNSFGEPDDLEEGLTEIQEKWSDAARKAASAARGSRKQNSSAPSNVRKNQASIAAKNAFDKAGGVRRRGAKRSKSDLAVYKQRERIKSKLSSQRYKAYSKSLTSQRGPTKGKAAKGFSLSRLKSYNARMKTLNRREKRLAL